jgi:hypothetical protein
MPYFDRSVPAPGDKVFTYGAGMGGSRSVVSGTVDKSGDKVRITAGAGALGERIQARTVPLSSKWTVVGEEHPDDRKRRESTERLDADEAKRKANHEAMLSEAAARNGTLDPATVKVGDKLEMPDGTQQVVEDIGDKGEIFASEDGSGGRYIGKDMRGIKRLLNATHADLGQPAEPAPY